MRTGHGYRGDLLRAAFPERFGAAGDGGACGTNVIDQQNGERDGFLRRKSVLQIGSPTGEGEGDLAFCPPVPPREKLTAGQGQTPGDGLREETAMVNGPVAAAVLGHGDPGDYRIRGEGEILRQRQNQGSQRFGGAGFRPVLQAVDEGTVNPRMGAEPPGDNARNRFRLIPGKDKALGFEIQQTGGAEGFSAGDPSAGAAKRGFGPDRVPKPGGKCVFGRAEPAEEPGFESVHGDIIRYQARDEKMSLY